MRVKTPELSKIRKNIFLLSKELDKRISFIIKAKELTKGSIYIQKKKCGHHKCKCNQGYLHHSNILSFCHNKKTKLIPLTKFSLTELSEIKKRVKHYQRFRRYRAKIVSTYKSLISEINKLEENLLVEVKTKNGGNSNVKKNKNKKH